jgi:hypothetical protein
MQLTMMGVLATVSMLALACSGSGGGGGSAGAGGSGGSGTETFSCTQSGLCTQILVPSSGVSGETSSCTNIQKGTPGTGCSTKDLTGCCTGLGGPSDETQCYYNATSIQLTTYQGLCKTMKGTWSKSP